MVVRTHTGLACGVGRATVQEVEVPSHHVNFNATIPNQQKGRKGRSHTHTKCRTEFIVRVATRAAPNVDHGWASGGISNF